RDGLFNLRSALLLLILDLIIVSCISLASFFALLTLCHIQKLDKLSSQSRVLQSKLLITLCAQTAVPVVFVYIPYFVVLTLPFFDIDTTGISNVFNAFISCFASADAIVVILLI
ncbi:hypothetical protein PFISCL1PPCAC_15913, partial [Pristionchus fissidentatus]